MSRGLLSFRSVGRKVEYSLTMYFGLYHYSQAPKKVSWNQLAQQQIIDIFTCSWETTTKIASSHTILLDNDKNTLGPQPNGSDKCQLPNKIKN